MFTYLRDNGYLLFEGIRGSRLHGLETEDSDIDTSGIFIAPEEWILGLGLDYKKSVLSEKSDDSWDELGKFVEELSKSNPNAIETLFIPEEFRLSYNPILNPLFEIRDELITKECFNTFYHYAETQITRAKGLNKAININPDEVRERKTPLHFCNVLISEKTVPLLTWLEERGLSQEYCGISKLSHSVESYALFYDWGADKRNWKHVFHKVHNFRGIISQTDPLSSQLRLSSIPKGLKPLCTFQFNECAYSDHCTKYRRYWDWVRKRNQTRYKLESGYDFNAKNMCNVLRLMTMAKEMADGRGLILDRSGIDREFLLDVKEHRVDWKEITELVNERKAEMLESFSRSKLPESPDLRKLDSIMINIRKDFYGFF